MYTVYNEDEGRDQLVEEPDPSYTYTYADYMRWNFLERLELLRGKIFRMGALNTAHQLVGGKLYNEFYNYLKGKSCQVFIAPYDIRLPIQNKKRDDEITTVVQPDVCVVCDSSKVDERGVCGAPDLVIEILSPGNSKKEVRDKYELYEEAGVKEYWVVNPTEQNLVVFLLTAEGKFGGARMYANGDRLNASSVPGFSINVTEIFTK
ncbi:MAG TPA: Uma2 family endonuclease [Puia sp.]|nr:Uma2 family endonuclease [Puia sp.]